MYDDTGTARYDLSGYEHLGTIHLNGMTVYNAKCIQSGITRSSITSEPDAIHGFIDIDSENPIDCAHGAMTVCFSPMDESPFDSSP